MQMRIILNTSVIRVKRLRVSLGTLVAIEAQSDSTAAAEAAVEAAFTAICQINHRMHPGSPDSDLARINSAPPHTPVAVHPGTIELLDLARRINTVTQGVFDPCLPIQPARMQDIEVANNEVICRRPVAIDFGGFAKGYAVDCAVNALKNCGCSAGLVNAGGDLRVFGQRTEPIFLRGPAGALTSIDLDDSALAVSDADSNQRPAEHQGYYIRGSTEANCPAVRYAAVVAKEAVIADALAKCVLLCSASAAENALRTFEARRASEGQ
jgi:thiamine biosynthesis lipoprotein